jgi:hypothetical protein
MFDYKKQFHFSTSVTQSNNVIMYRLLTILWIQTFYHLLLLRSGFDIVVVVIHVVGLDDKTTKVADFINR